MTDNPLSKANSSLKFQAQKRWADAHPLEKWAHAAVQSAIRRGILNREPCAVCGAEPADFHHDPAHYDQPLHGQFLCRSHHRREHARLKCEAAHG
jgi:hypothetical protein